MNLIKQAIQNSINSGESVTLKPSSTEEYVSLCAKLGRMCEYASDNTFDSSFSGIDKEGAEWCVLVSYNFS